MLGWMRVRRQRRLAVVTFCDGCGQVCDRACRAAMRRSQGDRALMMAVMS
jgi:hypothetical protein